MRTLWRYKFIYCLTDKKKLGTKFEVLCNFYSLGQQLNRGVGKLPFFLVSLLIFTPKPRSKDVFRIQHTVVYRRYFSSWNFASNGFKFLRTTVQNVIKNK